MREWLSKNRHTVILYAVIILLAATLTAACFRISAEYSRNDTLTSQNTKLKKGNKAKDKEIEEKNRQIEEKDKQIEDLRKQNIELAAKREAAAAAASAAKTASPAQSTTSTPAAPSASNEELQNLIATMLVPRPVEKPLSDHVCYLTFDDGPSTNSTPRILDILKANDVKATFFVVGTGNLSLLSRIDAEGHTVGLHSNTHDCYSQTPNNIYSSTYKYLLDLRAVSDKVAAVTGKRSTVIRFPGGGSNLVSKKVCPGIMTNLTTLLQDMGYSYFDWNVSSGDADGKQHTPAEITASVLGNPRVQRGEGICVLMHDTNPKTSTVDALDGIIKGLKEKGYRFEALAPGDFGFHHTVAN